MGSAHARVFSIGVKAKRTVMDSFQVMSAYIVTEEALRIIYFRIRQFMELWTEVIGYIFMFRQTPFKWMCMMIHEAKSSDNFWSCGHLEHSRKSGQKMTSSSRTLGTGNPNHFSNCFLLVVLKFFDKSRYSPILLPIQSTYHQHTLTSCQAPYHHHWTTYQLLLVKPSRKPQNPKTPKPQNPKTPISFY